MKHFQNQRYLWRTVAVLFLVISAPAAMAMQEEIVGAVIDTGAGYAIIANSGEYIVIDKDLSKYVGNTVAVEGDVEVGADSLALDHINTIQVLSSEDLIRPRVAPPRVN